MCRVYEQGEIQIQNKCLINIQLKVSDLMISQALDYGLHWFYVSNRGNAYDNEINSI